MMAFNSFGVIVYLMSDCMGTFVQYQTSTKRIESDLHSICWRAKDEVLTEVLLSELTQETEVDDRLRSMSNRFSRA